jgi:endonuclease-3
MAKKKAAKRAAKKAPTRAGKRVERSGTARAKTTAVARTSTRGAAGATAAPITAGERARALELYEALKKVYPDARCELEFRNPHELLVATILSAQATDVGVNKATPALFARFPTPSEYAASSPEEIEGYIRTIGLFRNKAKAIHAAMKEVVERYGGEVPRTMEELLTLRGVARKTANVVLGNAFSINEGVVVDTHVERLSVRMGLAAAGTPIPKIEKRLMELFPRDAWCEISHLLIFHGRRACKARGGTCESDPICERFGVACEKRVERAKDRGA